MNTTKHTPGHLWKDVCAERDGRITTHYFKIGSGNMYMTRGVGMTEEETRANVRLAASAPSLVAQLEEARETIEEISALSECEAHGIARDYLKGIAKP